ncbi:Glutathione synthetase [Aphelenchoides fujianensis]|nr:Glutathione synthetase [Aphelenchoides fujianensis]
MDYVEKLVRPEALGRLVEDAVDFAHCNGLVIRTADHKDRSDVCQNAPFALLPSPFPRKLFDQGMNVQLAMNLLYFKISWDSEFLLEAHADVVHEDEFTRRMVDCYQRTMADGGPRQKLMLLTQRADYMCHVEGEGKEPELKQIEVNNIAVSMGGLAQRATLLHRRMLSKLGAQAEEIERRVPDNHPIELLGKALFKAWLKFNNPKAAVLVVIEDVNQNQVRSSFSPSIHPICSFVCSWTNDTSNTSWNGLAGPHLRIIRSTFTQAYEKWRKTASSSTPITPTGRSVWFTSAPGYAPQHYHGDREWEARLRMELSTAIKTPWIGLQLANTKKVQQVLAKPGVVERFLDDPAEVHSVRATFAGLWGLEREDEETEAVVRDAIENPHKYVLKPQLEGGGGNFYGNGDHDQTARVLRPPTFRPHPHAANSTAGCSCKSDSIFCVYVQSIVPLQNYHVRAFHEPVLADTVSELGTYGFLLGDGEKAEAGWTTGADYWDYRGYDIHEAEDRRDREWAARYNRWQNGERSEELEREFGCGPLLPFTPTASHSAPVPNVPRSSAPTLVDAVAAELLVPGVEAAVVRAFLLFLYRGRLADVQPHAIAILALAVDFEVGDLTLADVFRLFSLVERHPEELRDLQRGRLRVRPPERHRPRRAARLRRAVVKFN